MAGAAAAATALVLLTALGVSTLRDSTPTGSVAAAEGAGVVEPDVVPAPEPLAGKPSPSRILPGEVDRPALIASRGGKKLRILPGVTLEEKPTPEEIAAKLAREAEKQAQQAGIPSFLVASFNILGSQHTAGKKDGYGSGTARAVAATSLIRARGVSIVGFSEIQADQLAVFRRNAPGYGVYPGTSAGGPGVPQSLAWNAAVWNLEEAWTFSIPFSGQIRPQPVVRLSNRATGAQIWAVNVHNSPRGMEAERDRAMAIEVGIINKLAASGLPIVMTGDFNEKEEALCRFSTSTPLRSAVGGSGCTPARGARVDWIFASGLGVESYWADRNAPIPSITDHAVLFSRLSR